MRIPNGGKYYWECEIDAGKDGMGIGIIPADTPTTSANPSTATLVKASPVTASRTGMPCSVPEVQ